ncbi:MAG: NADPH2:quinone reductase [Myxococcota bacterium]|jgi:NADPH2:quinone reductase
MKAAVIYENGDPSVLRYEEIADPDCRAGYVTIEVEAISLEGGDLLARAYTPLPVRPHVVGYLCAGVVRQVGAGVDRPSVGDRVVTLGQAGSHAQRRSVPAAMTWPVPHGMDLATAACVPIAFGTAQECLEAGRGLERGATVLVHGGAGGVGMAAIQLAAHAGVTVFATASSDDKLDRLRTLGLEHGINYVRDDFVEVIAERTSGRGVDLILDPVGGDVLVRSVAALANRGTLVSVGVAARSGSDIAASALWEKNNTLRGVYLGGALRAEYDRVHPMIDALIGRVGRGELQVVIDRSFALEEASAAHTYQEGRGVFGRVVLNVSRRSSSS